MKYERPAFMQPGIEVEIKPRPFSADTITVPKLDYPISPRDNFYRVFKHDNPMWVPNSMTDFDSYSMGTGPTPAPSMWGGTERREYTDAWGVETVFVPEAGGPMHKPGSIFLEDVTKWEEKVKFPVWGENWEETAKWFMEEKYNPDLPLRTNIGQGLTERLVALMGGYPQFLVAIMIEPEACLAFFERYADYMIARINRMLELVPFDMITYHDDWGTERDTFYSERIMEELLFEQTKRIIDACKSKGAAFELHSCGNIERFVPYMVDLGVDFMQIQRRANDVPKLKQKYGGKIGFCSFIERTGAGYPDPTPDEYCALIRETVDLYGSGGGMYGLVSGNTNELTWAGTYELFCYSREFYEKEQGRD